MRRIHAKAVGSAAWRLGAGRARKEDDVSPTAGVVLRKVAGDRVAAGDVLLELHADDPARLALAQEALADAVEIGPEAPAPRTLVHERITI